MSCVTFSALWLLSAAVLFEPFEIDMENPEARVFLAQGDADRTADVFLLAGRNLTVRSTARKGMKQVTIQFEAGTSAFDVTDLDGDGQNEVIAVSADQIVRYSLVGDEPSPTVLFERQTLLSDTTSIPCPQVLVITNEGENVLALPQEHCVELLTPDGELVTRYDLEEDGIEELFRAVTRHPSTLGPPGSLELRVSHGIVLSHGMPEELAAPEPLVLAYRYAWPSQLYDAVGQPYTAWPWFPLKTDGGIGQRVLYAKPKFDKTLVRIYEGPDVLEAPDGKGVEVSPPKLYPGGIVVTEEDLPDFNGDGYVDLVLRSAPEPKLSVGSITRAVTGGSWPLHVTMHLFSPEDNRYKARPFARISCRIPPFWFVRKERGIPMRNCVFRDFNGDGRSDCGWCIAENEFAVWLCKRPQGFGGKPDWRYRFPEEGVSIEFAADLDGHGRTSLGFRGEKTLYVFHRAP